MHAPTIKYRPDIDGLRALAILPVVWFHSGLPGLPGGFTGVDTFFVISGYLITLIIHREVAGGNFQFARFYERRVRRIAPALLFVTAATTVAAFALLLPYELEQYSRSAIAALAMVSNVFFWRTDSYFALADSVAPMLHTWSLGVEEQFYLFFPVVLILSERFRAARPTIAVLLVTSLALCLVAITLAPTPTFYLLPTRGWELMIGASLAVGLLSIPTRLGQAASLVGVVMVAASAAFISENRFPDWQALVPTVGAALVIGSGPHTTVARALTLQPFVFIGKISYSLYLWHWPIFVFMRHLRGGEELPLSGSVVGIVLAFALASVSYHWIERPARQRSTPYRKVLLACGVALTGILAVLVWVLVGRGLPQRLSPSVRAIAEGHSAYAPLARSCFDIGFENALRRCRTGPSGPVSVLLWGDSHAAAVSEAVVLELRQPVVILSIRSCAPAVGWTNPNLSGRYAALCRDFNESTLRLAERTPAISTVVLSAYWTSHERSGDAAFWQSTQRLVDRLNELGKRVVVVAGIPEPGVDVPSASAIRARFGREPIRLGCSKPTVPLSGALVVDVSAGFCGKLAEGLFTDDHHISRKAGLEIVAPIIRQEIRQ